MFVKPSAGCLVRDPDTLRPLSDEGKEVPESAYWLRRLKAGDVAKALPPVVSTVQISDSPSEKLK